MIAQSYTPILKSKEGEFQGLARLNSEPRETVVPLIDVTNIPWDFELGQPKTSLRKYLDRVSLQIVRSCALNKRTFVDLYELDSHRRVGGEHPVAYVFALLRATAVHAIPVTGLERDTDYWNAVSSVVTQDRRGVCLRLIPDEVADATILTRVLTFLSSLALSPRECDVVLDFRALDADSLPEATANATECLGHLCRENLRSVIVAGSSFPQHLGAVRSEVSYIERLELSLWRALRRQRPGTPINFGDYGVSHPDLLDLNPAKATPSAAIRYTVNDSWLVIKGRSIKLHTHRQFHQLASLLVSRDDFRGRGFCWGDQYIEDCAQHVAKTGNLTTWRGVGTNHHLTLTAMQVANEND